MATVRGQRNNLLAGSLVLFAVIAMVTMTILIAGGLEFFGKREYTIHFSLRTGVHGIQTGAPVMLGGKKIGSVKSDSFVRDPSGDITAVAVVISIDDDLVLREGVQAHLEQPLLGSLSAINFVNLGSGAPIDGQVITGRMAPPAFLSQAGYGDEEAANLKNMLNRGSEIVNKFNDMLDEFRATAMTDVRHMVADARTRSETWFNRVDSITKNFDEGAARGKDVVADVQVGVDQLQELLATAQAYLDENRADVRAAIENSRSLTGKADDFMDRLNGEIADAALGMLEDGRAALAEARTAIQRIDERIIQQTPNIQKILANFRLASDQMRDMMAEVRRSPWRLLYRPDTREVEYELLYDSARVYAAAVSDLRESTEALKAMIESGGRSATRGETLEPMLDSLYDAYQKFQEAETLFLKELTKE